MTGRSIPFTASACALAQAIYYARSQAFGIGVPDWHKLPKPEQDSFVERAAELLDELQPAPKRSADYMRIVFGHISPSHPWGESA